MHNVKVVQQNAPPGDLTLERQFADTRIILSNLCWYAARACLHVHAGVPPLNRDLP